MIELDGRKLDGSLLETDVCVVGAGPAGLTLARAFVGGAKEVLLLESGGFDDEPAIQRLNGGRTIGDRYRGLERTRHRGVGGTANMWNTPVGGAAGAKFVPLDEADVAGVPELPWSGWPLPWLELERWYREAQVVCGLGAFAYGGARWSGVRRPVDTSLAGLETRVYQLGRAAVFTGEYRDALLASPNVRLCHHATVSRLTLARGAECVEEARVACVGGARFRVRASQFVLAAGAIENARILLLMSRDGAGSVGAAADWIGRCFMEHPRDHALTLVPRSTFFEESGFYDSHTGREGSQVQGRFALTEELRRREQLPNVSVTLVPRLHTGRRLKVPGRPALYPPAGTGWSEQPHDDRRHDAFVLLMNLEQAPHRENRIVLAGRRDRLGVPLPELHWRWCEYDQVALERLRVVVAREFEACRLGRVEIGSTLPDPNAHHHSGTTRMSAEETSGVVDPNGLVHGLANLYVCGASVFPTAGFANPTLTIVALALRLAAHLDNRPTGGSAGTT